VRIETPSRFATAFAEVTDARPDALLILPDPVLERGEVTQFALTARLPTMFTFGGPVVRAGGLIAYGPSLSDLYRRAAVYVRKILEGARPGDLPVEQPTTFELIINRQTARALGLTIPPSVLLQASQLID